MRKTNYCWVWTANKYKDGYGQFKLSNGTPAQAHRIAYMMLVGPIPDELVIDHVVCHNPPCVNPAHLEAVTVAVNTYRGLSGGMNEFQCAKGHFYDEVGFYQQPKGKRCKQCVSDYGRARYRAKKEAAA